MELYFLWLTSLAVVNTPQGLSGAGTQRWSPPEEDDYHCIFKGNRRYLHHWSLIMDCLSEVSPVYIKQLRVYILWEEGASKGNHEEQEAANSQNLTRMYFSFSFHFPPLSKRRVADSKPGRGRAELVAIWTKPSSPCAANYHDDNGVDWLHRSSIGFMRPL